MGEVAHLLTQGAVDHMLRVLAPESVVQAYTGSDAIFGISRDTRTVPLGISSLQSSMKVLCCEVELEEPCAHGAGRAATKRELGLT